MVRIIYVFLFVAHLVCAMDINRPRVGQAIVTPVKPPPTTPVTPNPIDLTPAPEVPAVKPSPEEVSSNNSNMFSYPFRFY